MIKGEVKFTSLQRWVAGLSLRWVCNLGRWVRWKKNENTQKSEFARFGERLVSQTIEHLIRMLEPKDAYAQCICKGLSLCPMKINICLAVNGPWTFEKMESCDETGCQDPEGLILCINNYSFYGSVATMNMYFKCHKDTILNQQQDRPIASSIESIVNGNSNNNGKEIVVVGAVDVQATSVER
ncbi:hypothetical protein SADUNF_Sadunf08G0020700 [Salix dunnii]|uniref:Uncharacterized protein n=1 Tax=Salix dunnii TaxID=1413687 RepID=A0A835MRV4_9ROSI|nr:hypothetical protein SADUNF_Sadunf08G0020700 [Salix dunnii]